MPSLPRIITVDPTGNVARIVRAAIDLAEYTCRQIDVPTGAEAIEELQIGGSLMITALRLSDMNAFELMETARVANPRTAFIIVADEGETPIDLEDQRAGGYLYLQRPVDVNIFTGVLFAGMRGTDIFEALKKQPAAAEVKEEMGPVPLIDIAAATKIIDDLMRDIGARSILLIGRDGSILLERGSVNYLKHDPFLHALLPTIRANIDMREIVGGDASMLQFYDGDQRDVYTISVGLHHTVAIVYDGENGSRQFGSVNSFGRRAVQKLIDLLGAEAFFIRRVQVQPEDDQMLRRRMTTSVPTVEVPVEEEEVEIARGDLFTSQAESAEDSKRVQLEAIADFDPALFDSLANFDESAADDLFNFDQMGQMANENQRMFTNTPTFDQSSARDMGIING
jgi:CheY-like chemotaxis protein